MAVRASSLCQACFAFVLTFSSITFCQVTDCVGLLQAAHHQCENREVTRQASEVGNTIEHEMTKDLRIRRSTTSSIIVTLRSRLERNGQKLRERKCWQWHLKTHCSLGIPFLLIGYFSRMH